MKKLLSTSELLDRAGQICKAIPGGVLLTAKDGERVNSMTIGWGTIGIEWGKPIFIAYVRPSRFTYDMICRTGEFTVNIPVGDAKQILNFCGKHSGRDVDKVESLNLTLENPLEINAPGIRQLPLTLECRVIYQQEQILTRIPQSLQTRFYPDPADCHTAFYGEICSAYLITD